MGLIRFSQKRNFCFRIESEASNDSMIEYYLVTIVHAIIGEPAFGTSPGEAMLMVTLRGSSDEKTAVWMKESGLKLPTGVEIWKAIHKQLVF
jgi:hypothetical protein